MKTTFSTINDITIFIKEDNHKVTEVGRDFDSVDSQKKSNNPSSLTTQINEYLQGRRKVFELDYIQEGTPFQKSVWNILTSIPYGETWTYKQVARALGDERKVRAVANAIGKNKLMILVPCHRVIGSDGKLHGFAGGLDMKQQLLTLEKENTDGLKK